MLILECEKRNYGPKPPIIYLGPRGRRADLSVERRTGWRVRLQCLSVTTGRGTTMTRSDVGPRHHRGFADWMCPRLCLLLPTSAK